MQTFNVTAERLRRLADAIESGRVDPGDARLQTQGEATIAAILEEGTD